MMKRLSSAFALGAIATLTACGGGSGGNALPTAPQAPAKLQDVQFRITVPQSVQLSPKYISSATKSAQITVSPTGGAPLTPVSTNCTTSCSATVSAPVGSDQFSVKLYDAVGATGNILSQGTTTSTIVAGQANTVSVTFGGVVATIVVSAAASVTGGSSIPVTVTAKDAAAQTIVGSASYNNPITLTNSDTSGTTSLSTTTVSSPATAVTFSYNNASSSVASATIGASASGVSPSAVTSATVNKVAGSAPSVVSFLSNGAGSINASSTAATIVAISEYSTDVRSAPATVDQGSIQLQVGSSLTPLDFMRATTLLDAKKMSTEDAMGYDGTFRDLPNSDDWNAKYAAAVRNLPRATGTPVQQRTTKALPTVGTVQSFWISSSSIGSSGGGYASVPFTLEKISSHGLIWMDNSLSPTVLGYANQIGTLFDASYASDTANYGPTDYTTSSAGYVNDGGPYNTCNNDGSSAGGSTNLWVTPANPGMINVMIANGAGGGPLGTGVGGYFSSLNFFKQSAANCISPSGQTANPSNEGPMIVVGWFGNGTPSSDQYELNEDLVRGTAHELQHLINFVNHVIISAQASNDPRWLNEGMSVLSQDLVETNQNDIDDAFRLAVSYLGHPQNNSITGFLNLTGATSTYNCGSCYGGSYLFTRYMFDHFGGTSFTQGMTTGTTSGQASLLRLGSYSSMGPLLGDFALALQLSNTGITSDPKYNFTGINLHHTYVSPNGQSDKIFNGPLPITGGVIAGSSPVGLTNMPAGAFAYYTVSNLTGTGNAVKLMDTTGGASVMSLQGAIIQH